MSDKEALETVIGEQKAEKDWTGDDVDFQDFVKTIVVGNTTAEKAAPGTLREIVAKKMQKKEIIPCAEIWSDPKDKWATENLLNNSQEVASNLLNGIHCPSSEEKELKTEFQLMSDNDIELFNKSINQWL